ncbi:uncharacterized protein LOC142344422 isoform X4 [Convolutriloba macropyga]|uniref:uncharacterized protein LOC142344422 isoform X4 n=1 Tax=Convolutriloba macropyga TaxID=536237 RepID=UPI003F522BA2
MFVYDNKGPSPTVYDSGITHGKVNNLNNVVNKDNTSITLAPQLSTSSHYHPSLPAPLTTDHDTYSGCPPEQVTDSPVPTSLKNTPSDYSQLLLKPTSDVTSEPSKYFTSNSFPRRNFMPNSSNDDGHESRSRDVGTRHTSGAFTPKGVSTEPYAPSSRHNQNRNYPHLSRRHRSHATSRDDILGDSHTALSSGPAGAPNYVTLTNDSDPRSLLFDKAHLARDSRSIYEGHYYPNPNYLQNQSQSNRNFTSSLSRNQHYQSNERDAISHQHQHHQNRHNLGSQRDLDSCDIPESRSSRSRHFRDSSPLKRKPFHESSSSNHRYPGDFQSQTSLAGRGNLSNRKELSKRDLQMRSQPDLSFSMTNNEFNNSNSHTASMNRSAINIHQGVLHHIDAADNTNNNSSMMNNGPPGVVNLNNSTLSGTGGIPGISMVPNNAKLGLSSKQALERLFHEVNNELQEFSRQQSIKRSLRSFWMSLPFHYHHKLTTLRFHEFLLILTAAVSLLCCYLFEKSLGGTLIIESMGILILLFLSSLISWWDVKLQVNDMYTRAQNLLDQIQETLLYMQQHTSHPAASAVQPLSSLSGVNSSNSINSNLNTSQLGSVWPQSLYPSLHAPISPSVSLQWTHRDHHLVNLPANLLVRGDVVEIRPGQAVFARVKQLQTSKGDPLGLVLNPGETYNPLEGQADDPCPTARLHSPMDRLACVVQETPFITQLRKCLNHGGSSRERSAWDNRRYAVVDFIEMKVVPIAVLTGLFINGVLFIKLGHYVGHQIEMYLLHQIYILIPLVPLLFPVLWLMWTGLTTASLLASCQQQGSVSRGEAVSGSWYHFKFSWRHFISIISGMSPSLSRTSNLLYGLGSTTIFSVVDKRGVLSWPNPKVERVFFIRPVEQPDDTVSPAESTSGRPPNSDDRGGGGGDGGNDSDTGSMNAVYVPEVMDLSCDHNESFFVHFDDERWQQHLPSLKPLGLNILLNTCNEYVEDSYTKFADHLLCVSSLENHSIAVVNRRCACELSEAIGFAKNATESYEVKNYIQSFRESQPFDPSDTFKMRRIKAILRKKTPFPFLCSVVVHDTSTGLQQLFTQGTADMLCDVCPDFWDGKGIHPLSPELRKKIHDFYTRASLSAYCTAFAYRPVFSDFSKVLDNFYLELPGGKKFQPNPTSVLADMENVHSTDFVSDAKGLAKAQSGQIFLGMVVMQYKAMPDVLDLIEDFESRCIRFVHFSHENELRSRIFAEKLGLETGWNCHVSLFANSSGNEHQSSEHSSKAASLTTLRSFAQNVIQANEKLKTLQSQNNIDINSAPSNVDENRITRDGVKDMNESVSTPASPALNSMSNRISHSLGPTMERGVSHRGREFHDGASSMSRHQSHRSLARSQNLDQGPNATTGPSSMQQTSHPVNQETSFNNQMTSTAEVSDRKQFASHHQHHHLQHQNAIGQHQQQYSGMNTGSTAISRENSVHSHLKDTHQIFPFFQSFNSTQDQQMSSGQQPSHSNNNTMPISRNPTRPNSTLQHNPSNQIQCQCCSAPINVSANFGAQNWSQPGTLMSGHMPFGSPSSRGSRHRAEFNPSSLKQMDFVDVQGTGMSQRCSNPSCANTNCSDRFLRVPETLHGTGTTGVSSPVGASGGAACDSVTSGICSLSSDEGLLAVTTCTSGFPGSTQNYSDANYSVQVRQNSSIQQQHHHQPSSSIPSRKYVEIGVQTAGEKQEDSISLKGHEEAGLDEMFLRLEKLEQLKRQSQEEVNLVSGMNAIHTNKSANHNLRPGGVWENNMSSIGVDTRDAIAEQDEFISLPPMSPGSISESSSGAVSPLPNPRDHNSSHVNHSHNFPGSLTSNVRNPQGAPCLSHTNSVSPQPPMMAPSQSMHTQKHLTSRGTVNDTPSCDLSGSGNSPVEFCYQCSTLNNSNVLSANQNRVVPGGGIESQCSSIESTCMNYPHQNAMPGSGVNHLQKVSERPCPQPCCYSAPNTCNSHAQQNIAPDNNYCTQCNHNANNQGLNISHHGSNNTLLSNRAKSPLDTTLEQQRGVVQNSSSIRSNPSRRSGPPVPIRRYATLSGTENQYADHTTDASEALLNTTYSNQTQYSNHNQQFSNNVHNSGYPGNQVNSSGTGFKTRAPGLSRTGSINSQITHVQDDAISRTSEQSFGLNSLAGTEGVMFDDLYDLSNRAKLPRGVENIRPHLEHVDNVPLLVPLFTDCTPEATKEMMTIMQENSEVVCVYGSSLNVTNIDIFLQADVSIGVMPYVPQPCVRQPVCFEPFLPDGRHLSPLGLASALGSLPCSLQTLRNVSLTNIFHSASRLSENLKTALLFLLSCHLALILTQVLSAVCFQPPPFSGSLILWLVGFILPLLATSLLANPICDNSLQWTTASKNFKKILKTDVRDFITVFAMRFLPTCILLPLLEMTILYTMCIFVTAEEHCLLSHGNTNSTEVWNGYRGSYRGALVVAQNLVTWLLVVHFCFISASFVFPRTYIWRKAPFRNVVWAIMCPLIIGLQLFYFYSDVQTYRSTPFSIPNTPGHVWVMGAAWSFVALFISEMVKVYQVRKAYRQHRRSKLQFGTKLGMNSPF